MHSSVHLRLYVYSIPIIFSLLLSWISCETVQRFDDDWDEWFRKRTPYPWERYTTSTYPWVRYTTSTPRDDYNYYKDSSNDDTSLKLAIFLPIGIGLFLIFIFKLFVCNDDKDCCGDSSTSTSSRTVHAPPRRSTTPGFSTANSNTRQSHTRQFHTPSMTGSREGLLRSFPNNTTTSNISSGRNGGGNNSAPSTNNVTVPSSDRPPDYAVVVISDLNQKNHFPEVNPAQYSNSPPPKYDEMSVPKF